MPGRRRVGLPGDKLSHEEERRLSAAAQEDRFVSTAAPLSPSRPMSFPMPFLGFQSGTEGRKQNSLADTDIDIHLGTQHPCMHAHTNTCMHSNTSIHVRMHTPPHTHTCGACARMRECMHARTDACRFTHTHAHTFVCVCTHIYTSRT
jgi:hypothetical protein